MYGKMIGTGTAGADQGHHKEEEDDTLDQGHHHSNNSKDDHTPRDQEVRVQDESDDDHEVQDEMTTGGSTDRLAHQDREDEFMLGI